MARYRIGWLPGDWIGPSPAVTRRLEHRHRERSGIAPGSQMDPGRGERGSP